MSCKNCEDSICTNRCVPPTPHKTFVIVFHPEGDEPSVTLRSAKNANSACAKLKTDYRKQADESARELYIDEVCELSDLAAQQNLAISITPLK